MKIIQSHATKHMLYLHDVHNKGFFFKIPMLQKRKLENTVQTFMKRNFYNLVYNCFQDAVHLICNF